MLDSILSRCIRMLGSQHSFLVLCALGSNGSTSLELIARRPGWCDVRRAAKWVVEGRDLIIGAHDTLCADSSMMVNTEAYE